MSALTLVDETALSAPAGAKISQIAEISLAVRGGKLIQLRVANPGQPSARVEVESGSDKWASDFPRAVRALVTHPSGDLAILTRAAIFVYAGHALPAADFARPSCGFVLPTPAELLGLGIPESARVVSLHFLPQGVFAVRFSSSNAYFIRKPGGWSRSATTDLSANLSPDGCYASSDGWGWVSIHAPDGGVARKFSIGALPATGGMFFGRDGALYLACASRHSGGSEFFARVDSGRDELHLDNDRGKSCRVYSHWAEAAAIERGEPELPNFAFLTPGGIIVREGRTLKAFEYP